MGTVDLDNRMADDPDRRNRSCCSVSGSACICVKPEKANWAKRRHWVRLYRLWTLPHNGAGHTPNAPKLRRSWQKAQVPAARGGAGATPHFRGGGMPGRLSPAALPLGGFGLLLPTQDVPLRQILDPKLAQHV